MAGADTKMTQMMGSIGQAVVNADAGNDADVSRNRTQIIKAKEQTKEMKIDVMMTQTAEDMSSTKTRLDGTKVRLHQRKAKSYSRLAEQISAESFQVDLNARSASDSTWLEERDRSNNPDMDTEGSVQFGNKLDSGLLEGGDVDSSYWTRTSDEGSPVALASVEEDFHNAIGNLDTGASEDSRILSETPRKPNSPRGQAGHYSEEKGSEGHLAPSPMETDISSFFPTSKNTSGTSLGILSSKIQGLSPRQRLLYRYKLEELMSGNHNEEANGGAGLADESPELSALQKHPMDNQLDDGRSSACYIDAPESADSWQTSKSGGAEIEDLPVHPVNGLLHDCHICGYVPFSRDDYDAHMKKTHFTHKCHLCIYWSRSPGRLNHHMKKFHSEPGDVPANKKPKNPRKYTCKQCKFSTYVQEEIWDHTRIHVPASKLLSCPHCPFVCAFKHHMQYHMNNHMGYKPFKCSECNYRCNNKSMLNSHKKSHSNDYPFRCGVCNYAAKYRHALNIHLRKKKHVPDGELLVEDGQRPTRTRNKVQRNRVQDMASGFRDEIGHSMSWAESQLSGIMDPVSIKEDPERMNISLNASFPHSQPQESAYALPGTKMQPPLIPISELPFHLMNPNYSSVITSCPMPTLTTAFAQNRTIPQLRSFVPPHGVSIPIIPAPSSHLGQDHSALYETSPPPGVQSSGRQLPGRSKYQTYYEGPEQESMVHRSPRHYALETVQDFTNDSAEEWPLDLTAKSKEGKVARDTDCAQSWQSSRESPKSLQASQQSPQLDWYECQHCGIIFPDQILYSMHMGYHNKSDPFQCNLCGQRTKDRRDFFSHISMVAHD